MRTLLALGLYLFSQLALANQVPTILISIDGFSNQQLKKYQPATISKLAKQGLTSQALLPVFPTKTFPNHLSIITGAYPAQHGIIHNSFFRRDKHKTYTLGDGKNDPSWLNEKPIWVLAQEQGVSTASYFWPESETSVNGIRPDYYFNYDSKTTIEQRFDQLFHWLSMPNEKRPTFITTYFSLIDSTNHTYGHFSSQAEQALTVLDTKLGQFLAKLAENNISVNLVLVSDHGMTSVKQKIAVQELLGEQNTKDFTIVNGQTQLYIYQNQHLASQTQTEALVQALTAKSNGNFDVYTQANFPSHWQFTVNNSNRHVMPDIIINCQPGVIFINDDYETASTHGYDLNHSRDMEAVFIAHGPNIKAGRLAAFSNIHVFSLLAKLIEVDVPQHLPSSSAIFTDFIQ